MSLVLLNRRSLFELGFLAYGGLTLDRLLLAEAEESAARTGRSCIFVVQYGGASQLDTVDPKPLAPEEIRGPYAPIATTVPGIQLSEKLPLLAQQAEHFSLIRSMTHHNADHNGGMHICMTGNLKPTEQTPYVGSLVAKFRPALSSIPSYVWLQNLAGDVVPWYLTGGALGAACAPLVVGKDEDNPSRADFRFAALDPVGESTPDRLQSRSTLLNQVDGDFGSESSNGYDRFRQRAVDLVTSPRARDAFDLAKEPETTRERYGKHVFGQNLLLARRLIEAGVRIVTVNAWCGRASTDDVLATQGWDHHGAAIQRCGIFDQGTFGLGFVLPRFDQGLSALIEDLHLRGMLENTLVVVVGEFGRTPKIVKNPFVGRDHWPQCYSALVAGGGTRAGMIYGRSDRHAALVAKDPVTPVDLIATVLDRLGIPPASRFGPDGFSLRVNDGNPVAGLLL